MYAWLHGLLADRKGGEIFRLFSGWHFFYMALAAVLILSVCLMMRGQREERKRKACTVLIDLAFTLYMLDFFLMPFAYEAIDIEKLPFHVCTAMCVMCFVSRHHGKLYRYHGEFALLGFISNLVYLIYPAGVMWHAVHPLSYRVIQTLLFHCIMTVYGFLTIVLEKDAVSLKTWYRVLVISLLMTLWAMFGNLLYCGSAGTYSHDFNWFFTERDPFGMLPEQAAGYIMPALNIVLFTGTAVLILLILYLFRKNPSHAMSHTE